MNAVQYFENRKAWEAAAQARGAALNFIAPELDEDMEYQDIGWGEQAIVAGAVVGMWTPAWLDTGRLCPARGFLAQTAAELEAWIEADEEAAISGEPEGSAA